MFDRRIGNYSLLGPPRCIQCLVKTPSRSYLGTASKASSPSVKVSGSTFNDGLLKKGPAMYFGAR